MYFNPLSNQNYFQYVWVYLPSAEATFPTESNSECIEKNQMMGQNHQSKQKQIIFSGSQTPLINFEQCLSYERQNNNVQSSSKKAGSRFISQRKKKIFTKSQDKAQQEEEINQQFEDFNPDEGETKISRKIKQNQNRNILPNLMHQVISSVQKKAKSEALVKKLLKQLGQNSSSSVVRFYLYQNLLKQKLNHYMSGKYFKLFKEAQCEDFQIYSKSEQELYNKISRILMKRFLKNEYDQILLTSSRYRKGKTLLCLKTRRQILQMMDEVYLL